MVALPNTLRALVVDDDQGVRSSVGSVLEASGHVTVQASCRQEALHIVRLHPVHFGIVDLNVQLDDGLLIVRALQAIVHRLPFIVMSGALTPEAVGRAQQLGAHQCLEKPLDVWILREAVRRLIEAEGLHY